MARTPTVAVRKGEQTMLVNVYELNRWIHQGWTEIPGSRGVPRGEGPIATPDGLVGPDGQLVRYVDPSEYLGKKVPKEEAGKGKASEDQTPEKPEDKPAAPVATVPVVPLQAAATGTKPASLAAPAASDKK